MNTNKRKPRPNTARSPRNRGAERNIAADGVYQNPHFMHAITSHVGNTVQVLTLNGSVFEGVFRTFSSQFDVVLEMAHKVEPSNPNKINVDTVVEKLIFKPEDIITIEIRDVDLEYATRDTFQTDTAISKFNGQVGERELEPWEGPGCNGGDDLELEANANGWDPNEMFRKNEQVYGIHSCFEPSMVSYTTPLQKKDTKEYKDAEAKAAKIASEIEANPGYLQRLQLENGDEEERFAAVVRPGGGSSPVEMPGEGGKYVPPPKRKNSQAGKLVRSTPPPQPVHSVPSQQPLQQPQAPVPSSQQQTPQQAPQPLPPCPKGYASGGGSSYHHPPPFSPIATSPQQPQPPSGPQVPTQPVVSPQPPVPTGPATASVSVNQPPPVLQHAPPVASSIYPTHSTSLPSREPKVNGMESKPQRPQQLRTRDGSNVSGRYSTPSEQGKHSHHGPPSGMPPAPFPNTTVAVASPSQVMGTPPIAAPIPVVSPAQVPSSQPVEISQPKSGGDVIPVVTPVPIVSNPAPLPQRKVPSCRSREEHFQELKKFNQDFKLAEGDSADKKQTPPQQHPPPQHQTSQQTSQQQSQPQPNQTSQQPQQAQPSQQPQQPHQPSQPPCDEANKESPDSVDKVSTALKKSTLNPNAKEFVYNPSAKPFTPRSPSTPTPSRPHTPQTPQYTPSMAAMVMPPYVAVATSQPPFAPPNQGARFRKTIQMAMPHRPDIASQAMQVAAATGQPLLAPAPMHTQFTVAYNPQSHMSPQPYQQMVRMVTQQGTGMVPLGAVPTSISYHHESPGPQAPPTHQLQYMSPAPAAMGPPHGHPHHPHAHPHAHPPPPPPPNQAPSAPGTTGPSPAPSGASGGPNPPGPPHTPVGAPGSGGGGGAGAYHHHHHHQAAAGQGGHPQTPAAGAGGPAAAAAAAAAASGYQQPPPPPPQGHPAGAPPHTFPIMCPILPAQQLPPPHTPHHMMAQGSMQPAAMQYIHHHQHQATHFSHPSGNLWMPHQESCYSFDANQSSSHFPTF